MSELRPQKVTDVELAFPARVVGTLLPETSDIPEEFHFLNRSNSWIELVGRWFFQGLPKDVQFYAREGISAEDAYRHVRACLGSFEPKHEHKVAGCAYLLSVFFEKVEIPSEGAVYQSKDTPHD